MKFWRNMTDQVAKPDGAPEAEPKKFEIERKWLVTDLPDLEGLEGIEIEQGYLPSDGEEVEIRVRRKGSKYLRTEKIGSGAVREEREEEISEEQFRKLWEKTGGRIEKIRYEIPASGGIIDLDIYGGGLTGHAVAEVEFDTKEDLDKFGAPSWLGEEVTGNAEYSNASLAENGWPEKGEKAGIPEYELDEGVSVLVETIRKRVDSAGGKPVIVEIAGGSASGKTSVVSAKVKEAFGDDAIIFSMDDYYHGVTFMNSEAERGNELNWDQPEAVDLPAIRSDLEKLKSGVGVDKPIYSMKTGEKTGETERVEPVKVIIVEGLFALNDEVMDVGDVKAFVEIGTHGRILRRLLRDVERTGKKPEDILIYFSEIVEPMHEKYVQNTRENADLVIKNEYSPEVEAERSGLHEVQLKFETKITPEDIRRAGAEMIGRSHQVDNYYNPRDRDLVKTGEILRIREEGAKRILTYKGPKVDSAYRERPKFEFEISDDTEQKFLGIYGDKVKVIEKDRTLWQLDGILFSFDQVKKIEGEEETDLGTFVEFRPSKSADTSVIDSVIAKLGLNMAGSTKESYFEM